MELHAQNTSESEHGSTALAVTASAPSSAANDVACAAVPLLPSRFCSFLSLVQTRGLGAAVMGADEATLRTFASDSMRMEETVVSVSVVLQGAALVHLFALTFGKKPLHYQKEAKQFGQSGRRGKRHGEEG